MTCYLHPETPGKPAPLCKQDPWLPLLHRKQKTQATRLGFPRSNTTEQSFLQPIQEISPELLLLAGLVLLS
jgi:hypothetical protein